MLPLSPSRSLGFSFLDDDGWNPIDGQNLWDLQLPNVDVRDGRADDMVGDHNNEEDEDREGGGDDDDDDLRRRRRCRTFFCKSCRGRTMARND